MSPGLERKWARGSAAQHTAPAVFVAERRSGEGQRARGPAGVTAQSLCELSLGGSEGMSEALK